MPQRGRGSAEPRDTEAGAMTLPARLAGQGARRQGKRKTWNKGVAAAVESGKVHTVAGGHGPR